MDPFVINYGSSNDTEQQLPVITHLHCCTHTSINKHTEAANEPAASYLFW